MKSLHTSQAFNFINAIVGRVDPRTGLFSFNIPIAHLIGNYHMGPELSFILFYSPLNSKHSVYGEHIFDNVTRYHSEKKRLTLSSGESYQVKETATGMEFIHAKPLNFKILRKEEAWWVLYKSGLIEKLTSPASASNQKVVEKIYTPAGNALTFQWENVDRNTQLKSITDNERTLLSVHYDTTDKVDFRIWPNSEESHTITLIKSNAKLMQIINDALTPNVKWNFEYTLYEKIPGYWFLTDIISPTGLKESIGYQLNGHRIPENDVLIRSSEPDRPISIFNSIHYLPYVKQHIIDASGKTPLLYTQYQFSEKNFLGYGGQSTLPRAHGEDYLYNVHTHYEYDSQEITLGKNGIEKRIQRCYNRFHLLVAEHTSVRKKDNSCFDTIKQVSTEYYADTSKVFDEQVS